MLIHEETGSGKTLAYLLPLLHDLDVSTPRQVSAYVCVYMREGEEGGDWTYTHIKHTHRWWW